MYQITQEQLNKLHKSMEELSAIIKNQDIVIKELTTANLALQGQIAGELSER